MRLVVDNVTGSEGFDDGVNGSVVDELVGPIPGGPAPTPVGVGTVCMGMVDSGCGLVSCSRASSGLSFEEIVSVTLGPQPLGRTVVVFVLTMPKKLVLSLRKCPLYCERKMIKV